MTVPDVQGVSPEVAAYLGVATSSGPLDEVQTRKVHGKIRAVVSADNSLANFPDLRKFDITLLDAVAAALGLVVATGGEGERVERANEKLRAIPGLRVLYADRQRKRQKRREKKVRC